MKKIIAYLGIVLVFSGYSNDILSDTRIKTKKMILAKEICESGTLNTFCSDGYGQSYRLTSVLVSLNQNDFLKSYDDTIYMIIPKTKKEFLKEKRLQYPIFWELEQKFEDQNCDETIAFKTPRKYKRKRNSYQKKIGSKRTFDGFYHYTLYEMEFDYIHGEEITLYLPNLSGAGFFPKKVKVNYILDIKSIKCG
jgi:hypothetical protein